MLLRSVGLSGALFQVISDSKYGSACASSQVDALLRHTGIEEYNCEADLPETIWNYAVIPRLISDNYNSRLATTEIPV